MQEGLQRCPKGSPATLIKTVSHMYSEIKESGAGPGREKPVMHRFKRRCILALQFIFSGEIPE